MKKIKILTISSSGFDVNDGIGTVLYDYYKRFDLNRFELHLVIDGKYNSEVVERFESIEVVPKYLPSRKEELIKYFYALVCLIKEERYDIIYAHGSSALLAIDMLAAAIAGCRCRIVHSHNTKCDHQKMDTLFRPLLYMLYTEAFACGNDAGRWLFKKRPFRVVRNGRSLSQYQYNAHEREEMRKKLAIPEDCLAIGHVGNFNSQKNHIFLIQAFAEILKKKQNVKLFLIGDGRRGKGLQKITQEMEIQEQVIFVGNTNHVSRYLQAMDIMALPSLHEGLPLVVVEWQMAGLPCLVSDAVTREGVFTDLVEFEALENGTIAWADHLLKMQNRSLLRDDPAIVKRAKEAGYDIDADAAELQDYFVEMILNLKKGKR